MSFKSDLIALVAPLFDDNGAFFMTTPDGFKSDAPFAVVQIVGGEERMYAGQELPDVLHRRVQIWIWGSRAIDVEAKQELLYGTLLNTANDPLTRFVAVEPMGAPTDDYNDILKIFGTRQDFGIWWKYPV
jgi:hypothetical protein